MDASGVGRRRAGREFVVAACVVGGLVAESLVVGAVVVAMLIAVSHAEFVVA